MNHPTKIQRQDNVRRALELYEQHHDGTNQKEVYRRISTEIGVTVPTARQYVAKAHRIARGKFIAEKRGAGQPAKDGILIRVPCRFNSQTEYELVISNLSITARADALVSAAK